MKKEKALTALKKVTDIIMDTSQKTNPRTTFPANVPGPVKLSENTLSSILDFIRESLEIEAEAKTKIREIEAKKEAFIHRVEREHEKDMTRLLQDYSLKREYSDEIKEQIRKAREDGDRELILRLFQEWREMLNNK